MASGLEVLALVLLVSQVVSILVIRYKNQKIGKLKKMAEISKKIPSNIKFKSLMNEIMEIVKRETGAEACSLYIVDEERKELWFEVALGKKGDKVKEIRLKIGDGIAGWVAREGVILNHIDVNKDPRFRSDIGEKIDFKQKAMLTMPVKFKGKVVGVLQVINKINGGYFTNNDEELLDAMSSQIATAIENANLYKRIRDMFIDAISALASAIDAKDPYTRGHSVRVTRYCIGIGKEMGLSEEKIENLEFMALLHDIGKIGIKDSLLFKQTQLNAEEFEIMKTHTIIGARILGEMRSLREIIPGVEFHHEKYDGTGYWNELGEDEIPIEARIISVADTYDAMTSDRPYRKALSHQIAMEEINRCAGTQFDPRVVRHFNSYMKKQIFGDSIA